jgi:nitrogen regulatory protein PII
MKMIEAILKPHHVELIHKKLCAHGVEGMTVSDVHWYGMLYSPTPEPGLNADTADAMPRVKVEVLIPEELEHTIIEALADATWRDSMGDTPMSVMPVEEVVRVRTGERGDVAL